MPVDNIYIYRTDSLESTFVSGCVCAFDVVPLKLLKLVLEVNAPTASRKEIPGIHLTLYSYFILLQNI